MRNMTVATLSEDFVVAAEARGLSPDPGHDGYAARNAVLPHLRVRRLDRLRGHRSIVMEQVFTYPGLGNLLFLAVNNEDYPLMQAIFLTISFAVLGSNLLVDLLYGLIDPRTREASMPWHPSSSPPNPPRRPGRLPRLRDACATRRLLLGLIVVGFFILLAAPRAAVRGRPQHPVQDRAQPGASAAHCRHHQTSARTSSPRPWSAPADPADRRRRPA